MNNNNDSHSNESELIRQWEELTKRGNYFTELGQYSEAISLNKQALLIAQQLWARYKQPYMVPNLKNLGYLYSKQGNYGQAESYFQQALEMCQKNLEVDHPILAMLLNDLGSLYSRQGKFEEAEFYLQQALELRQKLFPGDHPGIASNLSDLGTLYTNQGKFEEAKNYYQLSLEMHRRLFPDGGQSLAVILNNFGLLYSIQGKYAEAVYYLKPALELLRRLFPEGHPDVAVSLNSLGSLYSNQGRFEEATPYYEQALEMCNKFLPGDYRDMVVSLNNLAYLYSEQGKYEEAESYFRQALKICRRSFPDGHPDVAGILNNLGLLYLEQGKYEETESYLLQALKIQQNLFSGDHPAVAFSLNNLGYFYSTNEKYEKALPHYQQALEMRQRLFPGDHPDVAGSLSNLSLFYEKQGKIEERVSYLRQALEMLQRLFPDDNPRTAICISNLGCFYSDAAKFYKSPEMYKEAIAYLQQALEMNQRLFPGDHPNTSLCIHNLGYYYGCQGKYDEAASLLQQALEMYQRLFPGNHPNTIKTLIELASIFAATGNPKEALARFQAALEMENRILSRILAASNEKDRLHYLNRIRPTLNNYLSLINKHFQENSEIIQIALTLVLQRKAINIAATTALNAAIYSGRYPHLESEFQKLHSLSNQIVRLTISGNDNGFENQQQNLSSDIINQRLTKAQTEYENLEKFLAAQVPEIQLKEDINYQVIASELPENTTLVEFVRFRTFDFEQRESTEERYLAFVIPSQQPEQIVMVDLGEAEPIDILIERFRDFLISSNTNNNEMDINTSRTKQPKVKSSVKDEPSLKPSIQLKTYNSQSSPAKELNQLLYQPLCNYLSDTKHLIIAPDSVLSLLPFELLPNDENSDNYLIDRYQSIRYITTARDLLRHKQQPLRPAGISLVIADPDYNLCVSEPTLANNQTSPAGVTSDADFDSQTSSAKDANQLTTPKFSSWMAEMKIDKINPLERLRATASLGTTIAHRLQVKPYLDQEAVEPLIRGSQCPRILLLATHGLYLPKDEATEEAETLIDNFDRWRRIRVSNPMMRSMLALAGANSWIEEKQLPETAGKGWLFAQDVASLDLWANEMTILLACQTGLGDVTTGEGVFGLRSAFASAGAKTVIMSLWSVSEKASVLLMERFFDYLEQGLNKSAALKQAQNYIRNVTIAELRQSEPGMGVLRELTGFEILTPERELENDPNTKPLSHPKFWGAWICQGE